MRPLEGFRNLTEDDLREIMSKGLPDVRRSKPRKPKTQPPKQKKFCECGCGVEFTFISGNGAPRKWASDTCRFRMKRALAMTPEQIASKAARKPCDCGCGKQVGIHKRWFSSSCRNRVRRRLKAAANGG